MLKVVSRCCNDILIDHLRETFGRKNVCMISCYPARDTLVRNAYNQYSFDAFNYTRVIIEENIMCSLLFLFFDFQIDKIRQVYLFIDKISMITPLLFEYYQ